MKKAKAAGTPPRTARRPAETDPWGRLRAECIYARRRLVHFDGAPEHAEMAAALAPAFATIDATPPHLPIAPEDADAINFALDEFRSLREAAAGRAMSDARAGEQRRVRIRAADAANEARRNSAAARRIAMNAEAEELEGKGITQGVNRLLAKKHNLSARQIRNIRAAPAAARKRKSR